MKTLLILSAIAATLLITNVSAAETGATTSSTHATKAQEVKARGDSLTPAEQAAKIKANAQRKQMQNHMQQMNIQQGVTTSGSNLQNLQNVQNVQNNPAQVTTQP